MRQQTGLRSAWARQWAVGAASVAAVRRALWRAFCGMAHSRGQCIEQHGPRPARAASAGGTRLLGPALSVSVRRCDNVYGHVGTRRAWLHSYSKIGVDKLAGSTPYLTPALCASKVAGAGEARSVVARWPCSSRGGGS